jgi:predicted KAP-like P-loop ATPase
MDKDQIKTELISKSNDILTKYSEPDTVEDISIMNMSSKTVFLGSLKVFNTEIVPNVIKDLNKQLKGYGELIVRDQRVTPCCSPSYIHISFNVTILN